MKFHIALTLVTVFMHVFSKESENAVQERGTDSIADDKKCKIDLRSCYAYLPPNTTYWDLKRIPKNEEELNISCSNLLIYIPCTLNMMTCKEGEFLFDAYSRRNDAITKLCDNDSWWYKALSKHMTCIEAKFTSFDYACQKEAGRIANTYERFLMEDDQSGDSWRERTEKIYCVFNAFYGSCHLKYIEECGQDAKNASQEVVKTPAFNDPCSASVINEIYPSLQHLGLDPLNLTLFETTLQLIKDYYTSNDSH